MQAPVTYSASPPGTLVVVTAAQGGLMNETGPLNPHAYRPNEFVVNAQLRTDQSKRAELADGAMLGMPCGYD